MNTDAKISFYTSAKDVAPSREITIGELVEMIHDEVTAGGVERVRNSATEDEKRNSKMRLPAVQLSGRVTEGNRKQAMQEGRFVHSGFLQLDVDDGGLNGKTPEDARRILGGDRHVLSAFITPSGEGAKALFKIKPCLTDEEHKQAFRQVEKYISDTYGMTIDPATKDPGRLCFIPSDSECTWNGETKEFFPPVEKTPEPSKPIPSKSSKGFPVCPERGIHSWLMDASWHCRLRERLSEADTIAKLDGFNGSLRRIFQENEVRDAVGKVFSSPLPEEKRQDTDDWSIPPNVFPVPAGAISLTICAGIVFPAIAKTKRVFMRSGSISEVSYGDDEAAIEPVTKERLQNILENCGHSIKRREIGTGENAGKVIWRKTIFPVGTCKSIMENDHARNNLPPIRSLASCPILTSDGEILCPGYHDHAGGVLITKGKMPVAVPFEAARTALWEILGDFQFTTPADKSRAMASLISPCLKMGGWIGDDFPLDIAEADHSQSGKTYRQKIVQRIYNSKPHAIVPRTGGVGSLDEDVCTALITGRPFILLDNFRGKLDSPTLESAIRGAGSVSCRIPMKASVTVDCSPFMWQLSTNGAELTRDLANRSVITRIRKHPLTHKFRVFPEGPLESHIIGNQDFYLGCVFAVVREWRARGCPTTDEHRHDFRGWCQALDWIVQNLFKLPPLLDGHREEQMRVGNPELQWLRSIILASSTEAHGRDLGTGDMLTIMEDAGILFPGNQHSKDDPSQQIGRIFGRVFRAAQADEITVDGFFFTRESKPDYSDSGGGRTKHFYQIKKA